jgi:hypothetical protein
VRSVEEGHPGFGRWFGSDRLTLCNALLSEKNMVYIVYPVYIVVLVAVFAPNCRSHEFTTNLPLTTTLPLIYHSCTISLPFICH